MKTKAFSRCHGNFLREFRSLRIYGFTSYFNFTFNASSVLFVDLQGKLIYLNLPKIKVYTFVKNGWD